MKLIDAIRRVERPEAKYPWDFSAPIPEMCSDLSINEIHNYPEELLARIRSLQRRGDKVVDHPTLRVADLELDPGRHRAFRGDLRVELTTKEFALLRLLMSHPGEALTRSQIISLVWDMNFDCDTNVIDVAIRRLRAKIDDPFENKLIHTLRGVGYVIEERS